MPVLVRILIGLPISVVIAVALFAGMRSLVAMDDPADRAQTHERPVIRFDVDDYVPLPRDDFEPEETPASEPREREVHVVRYQPATDDGGARERKMARRTVPAPVAFGTAEPALPGAAFARPDAVTDILIPAAYPAGARRLGLEGNCVMGFEPGPDGPANVRALSCTDAVFERAAIEAMENLRPDQVRDSRMAARAGGRTVIVFRLGD